MENPYPYKKWFEAVDQELSIQHQTVSVYDDPKKAIRDLIEWNVMVALDPRVSKSARDLIRQGHQEAIDTYSRISDPQLAKEELLRGSGK